MVAAGDVAALLALLGRRRRQAEEQVGGPVRVVAIEEAGLDGFWLHRLLEANGIESHVVDAASVAVRGGGGGKRDGIDGETLLRTLLAWRRGEPRVCSMVRPPNPQEEDRARGARAGGADPGADRDHQRIRGLLMSEGITDYQRCGAMPRAPGNAGDRRRRALPPQMKRELMRALDGLDLLLEQLKAVEAERDAMQEAAATETVATDGRANCCCALARSDRKRRRAHARSLSPALRQSPPGRRLRRSSAEPWQSGAVSTTRASPRRDSAAAQGYGRARLAVAAPRAGLRAEPVVRAARERRGCERAAHADSRARAQAAGSAVALRQRRRRSGGRRLQGRLSARASARPDQPRRIRGPAPHGRFAAMRAYKTGSAHRSQIVATIEDHGTAVTATGCELKRYRRRGHARTNRGRGSLCENEARKRALQV